MQCGDVPVLGQMEKLLFVQFRKWVVGSSLPRQLTSIRTRETGSQF